MDSVIADHICPAAQYFCIKAHLNFMEAILHPYNWFSLPLRTLFGKKKKKVFQSELSYGSASTASLHLTEAATMQPRLKPKKFLTE